MIKLRKAKNSKRGIYIQDRELCETVFKPGTHFKYIIDSKNKKVTVVPTDNSRNTVSKRKINDGIKPVIDIRSQEVLQHFLDCDHLEVEIFHDEIIVSGLRSQGSQNLVDLREKRFERLASASFSMGEIKKVSCGSVNHLNLPTILIPLKKSFSSFMHVSSFFSGAGIMDLGFLNEGFTLDFALEKDIDACETYRYNLGNHIACEDISTFKLEEFPYSPVMIGGPPCKPFSNSNRVKRALDHPDSSLIKKFIQAVKQNKHCKVFVLENVPQLLTSLGGKFRDEILHELSDFQITYGILNAVDYGCAQIRKRAIFIGSKLGKIPLPKATTSLLKTVKEAFSGLHNLIANQSDYSIPKAKTLERISFVPEGGNVFDIPESLRPKGTHSDCYRRLSWDKPSITIVNPRKSMILHPKENRIISIREAARLFDIPDWFVFKSKLSSMQQQVANAVPVLLSRAIANQLKLAFQLI